MLAPICASADPAESENGSVAAVAGPGERAGLAAMV